MFGYITINKAELKFKEFDVYHAYYCGLCRALKKKYGVFGQFSLTYDMTFVAVLLSSLYEPESEMKKCRCIAHPGERFEYVSNEILDYLADMNILLSIYKCRDDWNDEKKLTRKIYADILASKSEKQRQFYYEKEMIIADNMRHLSEYEKEGCKDADLLADCFGRVLAEIFVYKEDVWAETLRNVGYHLGRFIYLLDAYDDIEKDLKKKNFNPVADKKDEPNFDENVRIVLSTIMSDCCREYEMLPIVDNVEILRNILYSGVWGRYETVRDERESKAKN